MILLKLFKALPERLDFREDGCETLVLLPYRTDCQRPRGGRERGCCGLQMPSERDLKRFSVPCPTVGAEHVDCQTIKCLVYRDDSSRFPATSLLRPDRSHDEFHRDAFEFAP